MRKLMLVLAGFLVVSSGGERSKDTASIAGVVRDEYAAPIAGAVIRLREVTTAKVYVTQTDAPGYYELKELRAGTYSLWVEARGYGSIWIREIILHPGESLRKDVVFPRTSVIPTSTSVGSRDYSGRQTETTEGPTNRSKSL